MAIMFFLIACFCIVSPIIVLYTAGYRYDFASRQIKQTGVISIDIEPADASVFLNNVKINKKIPMRLINYAPGAYAVKFSKTGYYDWQKDITVESKKTSYLKNISLFLDSLPIKIFDDLKNPIVDFNPSSDGRYLLITTEKNKIFEIILADNDSGKISTIMRTQNKQAPMSVWSPFADFAVILTKTESGLNSLTPVNAEYPENSPSSTISAETKNWQWSKRNSFPALYFQDKLSVSSTIWFMDEESKIWTYDQKEKILKSPDMQLALRDEPEKIIELNKNFIILKTKNGFNIIRLDNWKIIEENQISAREIFYNQLTNEWLCWSQWELWTIYPNGRHTLLVRNGENISSVRPLDQYGVLLIASASQLAGFNPGYYTSQNLVKETKIKKATVYAAKRQIIFWGEVGKHEGLFELSY